MKRVLTILLFALLTLVPASAHSTGYVSWGIDEYELFDLTKPELLQRFKNKMTFTQDFSSARIKNFGAQFILTFRDGRVSSVKRLFIDGAGCHLYGPELNSKREALAFSFNGLSTAQMPLDKKDQTRLATVKALLAQLDK